MQTEESNAKNNFDLKIDQIEYMITSKIDSQFQKTDICEDLAGVILSFNGETQDWQ